MTWSLRVRSVGRRRAVAYARQHRFEIGAPVEFDERADAISALEYALGALAGDLVNTFTELARRRRVPLDGVEAVVSGSLENPLTVLEVVGEEGRPVVKTITLKVYVTSSAQTEWLEALWLEAQALSPLTATLRAALDLQLHLSLTA